MVTDKNSAIPQESVEYVNVYPGDELTAKSAIPITRSRDTRLIILAGDVESGKTTLLACIYEMFQSGPFAGYYFAGSNTLLGFERRCHDARISSEREIPTTEHTILDMDEYQRGIHRLLHLKVCKKAAKLISKDILFTDVSGEIYREIRNSTEECKSHNIFLRSDHFVLFLDGEKLCNRLKRDKAVNDAAILLRQCLDSNMLGPTSIVDVLFAKYDILKAEGKRNPQTSEMLRRIQVDKFENEYGGRLGKISFHRIAARPDITLRSGLKEGHGLSSLFRSWVEEVPASRLIRKEIQFKDNLSREFDKYYLRHRVL